jgi:hypothetical protein
MNGICSFVAQNMKITIAMNCIWVQVFGITKRLLPFEAHYEINGRFVA